MERAKHKININAVETGNILTEGLAATRPEHTNTMLPAIPICRLGTPEDMLLPLCFLHLMNLIILQDKA